MRNNSAEHGVTVVISNYTRQHARNIHPNSKLGTDLSLGMMDLEQIRLDLEDKYNIELEPSERYGWKKCKNVVASVNRVLNGINHG